jgi:hypothetical protein
VPRTDERELPWALTGWRVAYPSSGWRVLQAVGVLAIVVGEALLLGQWVLLVPWAPTSP